MSKIKVFCFGFGQVAECFVNKLIKEKKDLDLAVTSRDETHQIEYNNLKTTSFFLIFSPAETDTSIISVSSASPRLGIFKSIFISLNNALN